MDLCILIPLLVGLLSALLGYLLGRWTLRGRVPASELEICQKRTAGLEKDLRDCKSRLTSAESTIASIVESRESADVASSLGVTAAAIAPVVFDADAARAVFGKAVKQDDLTFIEGIGPKIQELFHNHGVLTWKALSETSLDRCQEILNSGGERYLVHKPGTWPRQAKMAYEGKWQDLLDWQDILDGGKE